MRKRPAIPAIAVLVAVLVAMLVTVAAVGASSAVDGPAGSPQAVSTTAASAPAGRTQTGRRHAGRARASRERTVTAYLTGYSYWDNTPPGSARISHPVVHQEAGGTGTYADPVTVAVGHTVVGGRDELDWPVGTRFYVPSLRRYLVVEDTCGDGPRPQDGPCHAGYPPGASTWLDVWVGGAGVPRSESDACMHAITGVTRVVVDPAPGHVVSAGPLSGSR
jgi:hypothetical protein